MSDTPTGNGGEDAKGPFPIVWRRGIPKYDSQTDSTDRNHKDRGNCQHYQLSDQSEPQLLR
jgi:hypothetical protein